MWDNTITGHSVPRIANGRPSPYARCRFMLDATVTKRPSTYGRRCDLFDGTRRAILESSWRGIRSRPKADVWFAAAQNNNMPYFTLANWLFTSGTYPTLLLVPGRFTRPVASAHILDWFPCRTAWIGSISNMQHPVRPARHKILHE
jgi:hypothetical protein